MIPVDSQVNEMVDALPWSVRASYEFRRVHHVNLQEARAVKREIREFVSGGLRQPVRQVFLNDSQVTVASFSKGRSSSFKLNGIIRSTLPYLIVSGFCPALVWIGTHHNPADGPSRGRTCVAPIGRAPSWLGSCLSEFHSTRAGLEVFAGIGEVTRAHRSVGVPMLEPIELTTGTDVFAPAVDATIATAPLLFTWFAPPCASFSILRNICAGGPLRPRPLPYGDPTHTQYAHAVVGNRLWRHT